VALRIEAGDAINRSLAGLEFTPNGRFKRYGCLPVPPGANGRQVRCACVSCGAHLYAIADAGYLAGVCVVCGSSEVSRID
jgi:hypothetical protein